MKNIVLIGMMGSAKSTVGKALSNLSNMTLFDSDNYYQYLYNESINDTFAKFGEDIFRDRESEVIKTLSTKNNSIIACGGGVILRQENMINLSNNGIIYFLNPSLQEIYNRICKSTNRPLLKEMSLQKLTNIFLSREELYKKYANLTIDNTNLSPIDTAKLILTHFEQNK